MAICFESTVVVSIIEYWITSVNPGVWITIFLIFSISLNIFAVRYYGECEFVFSSFKVLLIIGLILLSFISMLGGNPKHDRYGFKNWTESGLFHEYLAEGNTGKFLGFWSTLLYAAFASGGPDILALVSGEVINPRVNIPKAAKASYFRVYLFYIVGIFFMITLCSSSNPLLVKAYEENATGAGLSPWVIGIKTVGISGLDSLVNAVILTSAWSCSNAYFFTSTRTLYSMSMAGYAPRFFQKCLKNGVPIYCQVFISLVACISYLSVSNSTVNVLNWFINLCSSAFLVNYALFFVIFIRFRQALSAQGIQETALYHRSFFASIPCALIGLTLLLLIIIFSGFKIFLKGHFSVSGLFTYYFSPVFFFVLVIFWKVYEKTEFKTAETADITSGKAEIDEEERKYLEDKLNGLDPDTKFEVFINKYLPFLRWVLL
ncbi:hypothetical protein NADFUDRAFT_84103 [Nadsonia fulvescens var. elongata DSM 6958]|uniref:Amino acid permease/ SLC12A domain-containing protein n=1 Tax=Nadsonia fulvescens var. elongata DSM 6958 TaxID=857566 RepID=A0A1E3PFW1_9ASCO|nr:hypothetical protein NADFUDRAFT_84103 [Nadsonia fulvescens var. elongata DSM 6958]